MPRTTARLRTCSFLQDSQNPIPVVPHSNTNFDGKRVIEIPLRGSSPCSRTPQEPHGIGPRTAASASCHRDTIPACRPGSVLGPNCEGLLPAVLPKMGIRDSTARGPGLARIGQMSRRRMDGIGAMIITVSVVAACSAAAALPGAPALSCRVSGGSSLALRASAAQRRGETLAGYRRLRLRGGEGEEETVGATAAAGVAEEGGVVSPGTQHLDWQNETALEAAFNTAPNCDALEHMYLKV